MLLYFSLPKSFFFFCFSLSRVWFSFCRFLLLACTSAQPPSKRHTNPATRVQLISIALHVRYKRLVGEHRKCLQLNGFTGSLKAGCPMANGGKIYKCFQPCAQSCWRAREPFWHAVRARNRMFWVTLSPATSLFPLYSILLGVIFKHMSWECSFANKTRCPEWKAIVLVNISHSMDGPSCMFRAKALTSWLHPKAYGGNRLVRMYSALIL